MKEKGDEGLALAAMLIQELTFWEPSPEANSVGSSKTSNQQVKKKKETKKESSRKAKQDSSPQTTTTTWQSAVDPATGRTYYYDVITRKTQWEKPLELKLMEKRRRQEQRNADLEFFKSMEANLRASLVKGEIIPGYTRGPDGQFVLLHDESNGAPEQQQEQAKQQQNGGTRVRTISGMNEHLLAQLQGTVSPTAHLPTTTTTTTRAPAPGRPPLPRANSTSSRRDLLQNDDKPDDDDELELSSDEDEGENPTLHGVDLIDDHNRKPIHFRRNTSGNAASSSPHSSTMEQPNIEATIHTVCCVIRAHIVESQRRLPHAVVVPNVDLNLFIDGYNRPIPSVAEIQTFYQEFYHRSQMEFDAVILSLIYVERLIKETEGALMPTADTWASILFTCMVLASKVWDDLSMWNIDFSNVSTNCSLLQSFNVQRINQLERAVLTCLKFGVVIPASEYAKYYYLLRSMMIRGGLLDLNVLSNDQAQNFQDRTTRYQDSMTGVGRRRQARSVDWSSDRPVLRETQCLEQILTNS